MLPDSRRHELERHLLNALNQGAGNPAQRLMSPGVQEGLQQLFLALSDEVLQSVLNDLAQWQAQSDAACSQRIVQRLRQLAGLAQDRQLTAIHQLATRLGRAVEAASAQTPQVPQAPTPADCQQAAEELARLLFLYAAGQQREAAPEVLALLPA